MSTTTEGYSGYAKRRVEEALAEMRAIHDLAVEEDRDLTGPEHKRVKTLDYELQELKAERDRAIRADEMAAEVASIRGITDTRVEGSTMNTRAPSRDVTTYPGDFADWRDLVSEFGHQGYAQREFSVAGLETRALQSQGGSAIPTTFVESLTWYERTGTPMLNPDIITLHSVRSGEQYTFPRITADPAMGGTVTAEAAAFAELDATLSSVNVQPFKYGFIQIFSAELDQDNALDLSRVLAESAGRELALDIGTHLTTGTGTLVPFGFTVDATSAGTAQGTAQGQSTDAFFSYFDLVDALMSLPAPTRQVASWMMSTDAYTRTLKARDANGEPIVHVDPVRSPVPTLLGRPVYENPAMSAAGSAVADAIAVGDFRKFHVARLPVRVELSREYRYSQDQVALKVAERVDGRLISTSDVKVLTLADV